MKKLFMVGAVVPLLLMTFTFAQSNTANADMEPQERAKTRGVCVDNRDAAREEITPLREEMKASWETFREEYGSIKQYFLDLSEEDKMTVKEEFGQTRGDIRDAKQTAREQFKQSFDTGIIDEVAGVIIDLKTVAFDELRNYVTIDAEGYDEWVVGHLAVIEGNEALRDQIAELQKDWRTDCYDERTQKLYDKASSLVEKAVANWESEKILEKFPLFIERMGAMIEKTEASSVPDEQKESRLVLLYALQDAIQDILDSI